jgi:glycosyltransferase WbpL
MGVLFCATPSAAHRDVVVWLACALMLAATGLVDDLRPLSPTTRLALQLGIATAFAVGAAFPARIGLAVDHDVELPAAIGLPLTVVYLVGVLNIYNFLDGMDGLAGAQAVAAGLCLAASFGMNGHADLAAAALAVAAAAGGFLAHNYPPAGIFMGDSGSTFLGFTFAALGIAAAHRPGCVPVVVAPLALGPFLLDGSYTLLRRLARGERVWQAHRSHLYQRAVGSGLDHRQVLMPYLAWMAMSCACGIMAARGSIWVVLAMMVFQLLSLGAMWTWVARRERSPTTEA